MVKQAFHAPAHGRGPRHDVEDVSTVENTSLIPIILESVLR